MFVLLALTVRKSYIWSNASFLDSALRVETSFSSKVETLTLKVFLLSSSSSWVPVCAPHIGWKGPILVWQLTIFGIKQQCLSTYSWKLEKRFKTFRIFLRIFFWIFFRIFFRIFLAIFIEIYFRFFFSIRTCMLSNLTLTKNFPSYHIVKWFVCIRLKSELFIHCA